MANSLTTFSGSFVIVAQHSQRPVEQRLRIKESSITKEDLDLAGIAGFKCSGMSGLRPGDESTL